MERIEINNRPSKKTPYQVDLQSHDASITGFKIIKPEKPQREYGNFSRANYATLTDNNRASSQNLQEVTSAVKTIKSELPNTRKRMSKNTYRNILLLDQRNEMLKIQPSTIETKMDAYTMRRNRVTEKLLKVDQQKILVDLRQYAFDRNPNKIKAHLVKEQTGHVKPKCEAMEKKMKEQKVEEDLLIKEKPETQLQAELEEQRGWIRQANSKLYDGKLKKMIQDSSNGSDLLKQEIKHSDCRLRAVKSGIPLDVIMPKNDTSFFIPDIESYFKGKDRIKRMKGIQNQAEHVNFFITEPQNISTKQRPQTMMSMMPKTQYRNQTQQQSTARVINSSYGNLPLLRDQLQKRADTAMTLQVDTSTAQNSHSVNKRSSTAGAMAFEVFNQAASHTKDFFMQRCNSKQMVRSQPSLNRNVGTAPDKLCKPIRTNSVSLEHQSQKRTELKPQSIFDHRSSVTNPDRINYYQQLAQDKITQKQIQKMTESQIYYGMSYNQVFEMHINTEEEQKQKQKEQMQDQNNTTAQTDNETQFEEPIKHGRTNEKSTMIKLESLDEIKKRDLLIKQKEILTQIHNRKEHSKSLVKMVSKSPKNIEKIDSLKSQKSLRTAYSKSQLYLEKVRKQAGFDDEETQKAFNFHRVLKNQLENKYKVNKTSLSIDLKSQNELSVMNSALTELQNELIATGLHNPKIVQMSVNEVAESLKQFKIEDNEIISKLRTVYKIRTEALSKVRNSFVKKPINRHMQKLFNLVKKNDADSGAEDQISELEPSSPVKLNIQNKLNTIQQQDKKRIKTHLSKRLIKKLEKQFWDKFYLMQNVKKPDMMQVIKGLDVDLIWTECVKFLTKENKYISEANLLHLKDDSALLLNIYTLYQLHHTTQLLISLGQTAKKFKMKNVELPRGFLGRDGVAEDSDHSDYCDDDFKDLMSKQQVEQSIKIFYDRLRELINPIDEERLKLDSVHQVKQIVRTFYYKKNSQCQQLLAELDKMTAERPTVVQLKKQFFDEFQSGEQQQQSTIKDAQSKMLEIRMTTQLNRVETFKNAITKSSWYYSLIQRMIAQNIHEKPLTRFMSGKYCYNDDFLVDQIKNVIESGQVYNQHHFSVLLGSMSEQDLQQPEVQTQVYQCQFFCSFIFLVEDEMPETVNENTDKNMLDF